MTRTRLRAAWMGFAVLMAALILYREGRSPDGHDYRAFYDAGSRLLKWESPYRAEDEYPFKYAPVIALLFVPFAALGHPGGLFAFMILSWLAVVAIPCLIQRILVRDPGTQHAAARPRLVLKAFALGLVASLRFIDNEYHSIQVNLITTAILLGAVDLWTHRSRPGRWGPALVYGVGAFFKFHSLLGLGLFLKAGAWRSWLTMLSALALLALFPWPSLWLELVEQLRVTTPLFEVSRKAIFLQGFFPAGVNFLGFAPHTKGPFVWLFLPVAALFVAVLPKFALFAHEGQRPSDRPAAFLAALLGLLLLGVTASPLPWQHTYSLLWAAIPAAYLMATFNERRFLLAVSLFLGLTPRGILGPEASRALEERQLIFLSALWVALTLAKQARRYSRSSTDVENRLKPR